MGTEIERKFLVPGEFPPGNASTIAQGYLSSGEANRTVRVRIEDERAVLTIKGQTEGISRPEFEYEIPVADARQLLKLAVSQIIEKVRHRVQHDGATWEVDVFSGDKHVASGVTGGARVELPAGDYQIRYKWDGKEQSRPATVASKAETKVSIP